MGRRSRKKRRSEPKFIMDQKKEKEQKKERQRKQYKFLSSSKKSASKKRSPKKKKSVKKNNNYSYPPIRRPVIEPEYDINMIRREREIERREIELARMRREAMTRNQTKELELKEMQLRNDIAQLSIKEQDQLKMDWPEPSRFPINSVWQKNLVKEFGGSDLTQCPRYMREFDITDARKYDEWVRKHQNGGNKIIPSRYKENMNIYNKYGLVLKQCADAGKYYNPTMVI